jgi:hypothetical protein
MDRLKMFPIAMQCNKKTRLFALKLKMFKNYFFTPGPAGNLNTAVPVVVVGPIKQLFVLVGQSC